MFSAGREEQKPTKALCDETGANPPIVDFRPFSPRITLLFVTLLKAGFRVV